MRQLSVTQERIRNVVLPIYGEKSNGVPFLQGSAFLLRVQDAHFLVTAAHTLAAYPDSPLFVRGAGKPVGLNGTFTHTRSEGVVDLAFARLDERMIDLANRFRPVTLSEIDVYDWPTPHRIFTFIGYPHSANKANIQTKTLEPLIQPYSSHQPLLLEEYEQLGLNPCAAIAVHFDLSKAEEAETRRVVTPKRPTGISGGPVWRMGNYLELYRQTNREKVVGLAVEFRRKPSLLIGARVGLVVEAIRSRFPELSNHLPWNPRCRIKITIGDDERIDSPSNPEHRSRRGMAGAAEELHATTGEPQPRVTPPRCHEV